MGSSDTQHSLLDHLAEDFVARYRSGERPPVQEYADRHPDLAARIRRLFPTLVAIENLGSGVDSESAPRRPADMPKRIGEYRVIRQVGAGGMGVVYEAIQESLGRHVALKVLPQYGPVSERARERFRREARAAARLTHPHIVPVFGVGEDAGMHYYAMQYIHGRGLDSVLGGATAIAPVNAETCTIELRSDADTAVTTTELLPPAPAAGPALSVRRVAEIGAQVADALAYAHGEGVIHRDVKPSNLLVDDRGHVWVTDFGLAKTADADGLTDPGDIVGTIRYMAPERFTGWSDARSDIYALGATLYELLARRPMYPDDDRGRLIRAILHGEPPRPSRFNRAIPRDLETIILKAVAREPGDRYLTAAALADDLRRFLADQPIRARRNTWLGTARRWCRRRPATAGLAASVVALLLLVTAGSVAVAIRLGERNQTIRDRTHDLEAAHTELHGLLEQEREAVARAAEADRRSRQQLRRALWREAEAARWSGRAGSREEALDAIAGAARLGRELQLPDDQQLRLRNLAISCMARPDVRQRPLWSIKLPAQAQSLFARDLGTFAVFDRRGRDVVIRDSTGSEVGRIDGFRKAVHVQFSPDGRYLAVKDIATSDTANPTRVQVWDWRARKRILEATGWFLGEPWDFHPTQPRFLVLQTDGLTEYDLGDGQVVHRQRLQNGTLHLRYHPDGTSIALLMPSPTVVEIRDARSGALVRRLGSPGRLRTIAWSPDGRFLAGGADNWKGYVWHAATGQLLSELVGHQAEVVHCRFAPEGQWVVTGSWDSTSRLWDPTTGAHLLTVPGTIQEVASDGRRVGIYKDGAASVNEIRGFDVLACLGGHTGDKGPWHVTFGLDGRVVTSASSDGVCFWDVATGRLIQKLERPTLTALLHPAGRELITAGGGACLRWPVEVDGGTVRIGPPAAAVEPNAYGERRAAVDDDWSRLVITDPPRGRINLIPLHAPDLRRNIGGMNNLAVATISPDGKWIAGTSWPTGGLKVWTASTGRLAKDFEAAIPTWVAFTPDGKRCVTGSEAGGQSWEVGTWAPGPRLPDFPGGSRALAPTYSPDGRILAILRSGHLIELLDAATLTQLAVLEPPVPQSAVWLAFSPDGSRLALACTTRVVHLWDLREIRRGLHGLGLDWDQLDYPPAAEVSGRLRIEIKSETK